MFSYLVLALALISTAIPAEAAKDLYGPLALAAPVECPMWGNVESYLYGTGENLVTPSPFECPFLIQIVDSLSGNSISQTKEVPLYTPLAAAAPVECPMWANIKAFLSGTTPGATPSPFQCQFLIKIVRNLGNPTPRTKGVSLYGPLALAAPTECPMWGNVQSYLSGSTPSTTPSPFECPFLIQIVGNLAGTAIGKAVSLYTPLAAAAPTECPMWANLKAFISGTGQVGKTPSPFECPFLIKIVKNL